MSDEESAAKRRKTFNDFFYRSKEPRRSKPSVSTTTTTNVESTTKTTEAITTNSIWVPSSGNDPYLRQQQSPWKRQILAREFEPPKNWPKDKTPIESFWNHEKKLPPSSKQSSAVPTLPDRGSSSEFVDNFFRDGPFVPETILDKLGGQGFKDASGWSAWPSPETTPDFHEGVVVEAFIKFLNTIIERIGLSNTRLAVDCQKSGVTTYDGGILEPDVVVWANDPGTYPHMEGIPSSEPPEKEKCSKSKRPRDTPGNQAPDVEWPWCLIPIEFKTEAGRRPKANYIQIGTYAREVLVAQSNRRFVPSLLMTETHFEFILWDRAGAVISKRVNYHRYFGHFCSMLANILSWSPDRVGFDTTVYHSAAASSIGTPVVPHALPLPPHIFIKTDVEEKDAEGRPTIKNTIYAADETLFRAYTVRGRGTTCWRAHKIGDPSDRYLILDSWTKGGSREEHGIYDKTQKVKSKGLIELVALHDIQLSGPDLVTTFPDDIRTIRGGKKYLKNNFNLVHTRTVLRCDALPLGRWSSIEELVRTLRDAIEAHKILFLEAKILHRDIVPWNIFILRPAKDPLILPSNMEQGKLSGGLVDFTCATSIESKPITPRMRVDQTPGSIWFSSHRVLRDKPSNTHLDDLEAFYWILYSIFRVGTEVVLSTNTLSPEMDSLSASGSESEAARLKRSHLDASLRLGKITPSMEPLTELIRNLHGFLKHRYKNTRSITSLDAEKDYQVFINHFTSFLSQNEDSDSPPPPHLDHIRFSDTIAENRNLFERRTSYRYKDRLRSPWLNIPTTE